jgi:hypothetical protein
MADPILIDESHLEASQHQFVNLAQLDELCEEHSYVLLVVQRIVASLVSGLALLFDAAAFPRGCYVPCLLEFLEHFGKWWLLLFHGRLLADTVFFFNYCYYTITPRGDAFQKQSVVFVYAVLHFASSEGVNDLYPKLPSCNVTCHYGNSWLGQK